MFSTFIGRNRCSTAAYDVEYPPPLKIQHAMNNVWHRLISLWLTAMGGLARLAAWHLPGGPVCPPSRWAATLNVELGQTT